LSLKKNSYINYKKVYIFYYNLCCWIISIPEWRRNRL